VDDMSVPDGWKKPDKTLLGGWKLEKNLCGGWKLDKTVLRGIKSLNGSKNKEKIELNLFC